MNLQWLGHGNRTRTGIRAAGLALAALMISTWTGMGAGAWAQVATRTQLSAARDVQGSVPQTVFTAKVADVSGNPVSSGTVSFETTKGSLGSAVVENGAATLQVGKLPQGTSSVTAVYAGGESYASSSASTGAEAATASTLPDFSVTANPTSLTVTPGQFGVSVITITPENGFSEMVTLSCSGNPTPTSTCVFSPATPTPLNGAAVTSTLQIQTQAPSGIYNTARLGGLTPGAGRTAYAIVLPGMLALAGLGALRRRSGLGSMRILGFVALLAASSLGLGACSARYNYLNKPPAANPGTAAGTYNVTVAAYASNGSSVTSHTLNLTLTVQ